MSDRYSVPRGTTISPTRTSPAVHTDWASSLGYTDVRIRNGALCAIQQFITTTAIVVGLDPSGYQRRYCYELRSDARAALVAWADEEHPPGPWIKLKGPGIDLLNPTML